MGVDKPDVRFGMELADLGEIVAGSEFGVLYHPIVDLERVSADSVAVTPRPNPDLAGGGPGAGVDPGPDRAATAKPTMTGRAGPRA